VTDPEVFSPFLRPGPAKLEKYLRPYRAFELVGSAAASRTSSSRPADLSFTTATCVV
jgi:hypothetical protein